MNRPSLRQRIFEITRPLHDRLDSDQGSLSILSPDVSRKDYVAFLRRTYGFQMPIETTLASGEVLKQLEAVIGKLEFRANAILRDLSALGAVPEPIPSLRSIPFIQTLGHAMGVTYVLKGSQMGGLVMAKHLTNTLGLTPENGLGFFLPHDPKKVAQDFRHFAVKLDSFARCECDERDAIEAASETFALIGRWFESTPLLS